MKILLNCLPSAGPTAFDPMFTVVLDRPFLQGVIEHLVQHGATSIDVLVGVGDRRIDALLGDGTRWGCPMRVHHTSAPLPAAILQFAGRAVLGDSLLLASGHTLPVIDFRGQAPAPQAQAPSVYVNSATGAWTGWAWLPRHRLGAIARLAGEAGLAKRLITWSNTNHTTVQVDDVLAVGTAADLVAAHQAVLSDVYPTWQRAARETSPGVWVSRNALIAPGTQLVAPVFVGEDAHVRAETFGPYAVAGARAVVDGAQAVAGAVIQAETYLGPHLVLQDAVVSGQTLHSVRHHAAVNMSDPTFLRALAPTPRAGTWLSRWISRLQRSRAGGASRTTPAPADWRRPSCRTHS